MRIWQGLLDLLAPEGCAACDGPVVTGTEEAPFCAAHQVLVERLPPLQHAPVRAACAYGGPVADAIQRLKYGGRSDLAAGLARLTWPVVEHLPDVDCVVPVPLHPHRLRARGYNQAALLGADVARRLRLPLRPQWLHRVVDTAAQALLPPIARAHNVQGVFTARTGVYGRHVLLVDDVCTTGHTLRAAAEALREQACRSVTALVLARAEGRR